MSTERDRSDRPVPGAFLDDHELLAAIREHAYLEGDFVLRSGRRSTFYLDKYRFETVPELLEGLGARLAARIAEVEPDAQRLAGPELGAVALAAAASLASRLPFLIVRGEAKEYGTANRLEGAFEPGDRVVLIEDVVTSGGAAADAVRALRQAALECRTAICVIDREEGGVDSLARLGVRLHPLFRAADVAPPPSDAVKPHG
jgi:orotate phosphoribosyltransferase